MLFRLSVFAVAVCLAACSESPRDAAAPPAAPTAQVPSAAGAETKSKLVFMANPATIRRCEAVDGNATVSLSWDVRSAAVSFVSVKVGDQVFAEGRSTGNATTGNWVRAETVFSLFDAGSLKPLATLQVPFVDC